MQEDFRVPSRSNAECENLAACWREALVGDAARFDILSAIETAGREFRLTKGLELIAKPEAEMGRCAAYAQWVNGLPRIFARQSIVDQARNNEPWGVATLVHELMHIIFEHRRKDDAATMLPRLVATNTRPPHLEPHESAEHQTRVATAEFLMPRNRVKSMRSAAEIRERFGVSSQAATLRYLEVIQSSKPRDLPAFGRSYLEERKPALPVKAPARPSYAPVRLTETDRVWDSAPIVPGQPASEYRASRKGYPVRRSDYLKTTEFGWFMHDGQIFAHRETAAAAEPESEICQDCGNLSARRVGLKQVCDACGSKQIL